MKTQTGIRVIQGDTERVVPFSGAQTVLDLLRENGFTIAAPCGGLGTCGKCRVRVRAGGVPDPRAMEHHLISRTRLEAGFRFSCTLQPENGLVVEIPAWQNRRQHKTAAVTIPLEHDPVLKKRLLQLPVPSIDDQRPDLERVLDQIDNPRRGLSLSALGQLAQTVRREEYRVTALLEYGEEYRVLVGVEAGDTADDLWGIAVDVGTTTVAAYLIDLVHGRTVDVHSELNRQAEFGADVVSRISYAQQNGIGAVQAVVVTQVNRLIDTLTHRNGLTPASVYHVLFAGNTTMMHLLAGLDPAGIGVSPFIPVTARALTFPSGELGLTINAMGRAEILPAISGYVGADIVAAIEASRMRRRSAVSLLIDIGTNGEIVLGNAERLIACSTAAGPAFEGAQIRFGVGGIGGAVNTFSLNGDNGAGDVPAVGYTTIDSEAATGICGSGMLDIIAVLLANGVVDYTGRLLPRADLPATVPDAIGERCVDFEDHPAFLVVPAGETGDGEAIYLTEQDVRELQLAKAAIAAGIDTLLAEAGIGPDSVDAVYLAGGFGSHLNAESALAVGLLPEETRGRIEVLGNAAGIGAVMALASRNVNAECETLARNVRYVELSSAPAFQTAYIEQMTFGTTG